MLTGPGMDQSGYRANARIEMKQSEIEMARLVKTIRIHQHYIPGGDALKGHTRSHPEHDG